MKTNFWLKSLAATLFVLLLTGGLAGAEPSSEYLRYQEPQQSGSSVLSSLVYVFSLLVTFAFIIGLAYFTSRFLGRKMGRFSASGGSKVLSTLPLGPNRGIFIVEVAGTCLVLGVTEHNISLIKEITSEEEINKLRADHAVEPAEQFNSLFRKQLASLQSISQRFPDAFNSEHQREQDQEKGKR